MYIHRAMCSPRGDQLRSVCYYIRSRTLTLIKKEGEAVRTRKNRTPEVSEGHFNGVQQSYRSAPLLHATICKAKQQVQ